MAIMSGIDSIAVIRSCFACGEECARLLAHDMEPQSFGHRETIAHNGDNASSFYLIVEGAVVAELFGIDGQQAQLARHGPGEIFGAYPAASAHRADLTAIGNTRLLVIPASRLAAQASAHAEIANGIAVLLARQLDLVLDRMAARIGLSATGRFYRALLQLAGDSDRICPAPVVAALALSVHTTRETASRALAAVVRRGIVERNDDGLTIVSRRMLEELIV
jgi:CRP/FNR family transcriptional regulator, cyclic AMP receptor protein